MDYSIGFHKWAIQHGYDVNNADEITEAYEKYIHLKSGVSDDLVDTNKKDETIADMVNNPPHYQGQSIEVIQVIEEFTKGLDGILATDTGNIIKYILRWHKKNGLQDLEKCRWYLNHLIGKVEEQQNE